MPMKLRAKTTSPVGTSSMTSLISADITVNTMVERILRVMPSMGRRCVS